jgi:farnesyl diphosphate synthase
LTQFFLCRFRREIIADLPTIYEMPAEAVAWVDRMIEYTVAGGKMNRGLSVVAVQQTLAKEKGRKLSNKERLQSAALGWCIEWLQAFFLVADDVMDSSVTRRGQPCWYRLPEVKLIAINDSFILESCVFKILKRYFGNETYYLQLVDLFIEVTRQTELGQLLDLTSQPQTAGGEPVIDLDRFTLQRYSSIVRYKTAFYSFYLPVALGMIISGVTERKHYDTARKILLIMGEYFQVQDDFLDCYGTPEVIGKIGTDIQDNKCSWLVVQALLVVNRQQRKVLEENYGRHSDANVRAVKDLYLQIGMEKIFRDYEEKSYAEIRKLLDSVEGLPVEVFEFLLKKIYKRSK